MQVGVFNAVESTEDIFARVYAAISRKDDAPRVSCLVRPYVNTMGKILLRAGVLEVRISEILHAAPGPVREALAWILLSKLFRRPAPQIWLTRYRQFMNRRETRRIHQVVRQVRGRKYISGPDGECYNLEQIFDDLNFRFFGGLMAKPQLGWSRGQSRGLLGHFDSAHNAVILSRVLDRPSVPKLALEYVMYHEMLHLKHPVEHRGSRRCVHTPDFRAEEQMFEGLGEAKAALKLL